MDHAAPPRSPLRSPPLPPPPLARRLGAGGRGVYSQLAGRAQASGRPLLPLHVGDTHLPPAVDVRALPASDDLHRYTAVGGEPALVEALRAHLARRQGAPVGAEEVLVTAGATGGLTALFATLLAPGDEALLLAPYWPLVAGGARLLGATPVAVPVFGRGLSCAEALAALDAACTPRARLLYFNSPNNPTGEVLSREWMEALVGWAARRGLWVVSDEVYDLFSFSAPHVYARPLDPARVISAFSMSKAFGMAGYRCGALQGPPEVLAEVERAATFTLYSAPTPAQRAARLALEGEGERWAARARALYAQVGAEAARRLGAPPPQGGTFLFLDVSRERPDAEALSDLLGACADEGLLLAPGSSFGPYPTHVRLCFTAAPPERVLAGVDVLARALGRA
ncbi:MAG: pyridoxal phosphate-dependent aminotransferase [Deltaproteobacteria bacterium]|nr:pyridoxal phosphate-dependent aminotransferase [Deltaproteobacteria bacterium]